MKRRSTALAALVALSALAAACGGDDDNDAQPTTTVPAPTTAATTTTVAPTTTAAPVPTYVLTGLPVEDPAKAARPVLAIKIDNNPRARPQVGLNQADLVYEELVEGASRYVAVFQSRDSDPVGPVRSARTSDIDIVANLGDEPLFGNSGGNAGTMAAVRREPLIEVGHGSSAGRFYYRQPGRPGTHNLFTKTSDLYTVEAPDSKPPAEFFRYREPGEAVSATATGTLGVHLRFDANQSEFRWNAATASWDRELDGTPHVDDQDVLVSPRNVVVLFVEYGRSPYAAGSPEAKTVGSGEAWVFTDGKLVAGTWTRPDAEERYVLTDANGAEIELTPGQTWISLPKAGSAELLTSEG